MSHNPRWLPLLVGVAVCLTLAACGGGGGGGGGTGHQTATAAITIKFPAVPLTLQPASIGGRSQPMLQPAISDVAAITVQANDGVTQLGFTNLSQDPVTGVWSGEIGSLPVGPLITFRASATDALAQTIYSGAMATMLQSGITNQVFIAMAPIGGNTGTFPQIVSITSPAQVIVNQAGTVSIVVSSDPDELVAWSFAPVSSTSGAPGTFSTTISSLRLSGSGLGTFSVTYFAPTAESVDTFRVSVTDSEQITVSADFTITTVALATIGVEVKFFPTVTALSARRSGSEVTLAATVSDEDPATVIYGWSFMQDGGPTVGFSDTTVNPTTLAGYDDTVTGMLFLTVMDSLDAQSSTISIPIGIGQFGTVINSTVANYTFDDGTLQGWTTTGLWHVSGVHFVSAPNSVRYADALSGNYETFDPITGAPTSNSGELTSPPFTLPAIPTLNFDYFKGTECADGIVCGVDNLTVEIATDGQNWTVLDTLPGSSSRFTSRFYNLAAMFAGQVVQIRFRFDTVDSNDNSFEGVFIDNIGIPGATLALP